MVSKKHIADAIKDILIDEGTWMKAVDMVPMVEDKIGYKIHPNRIAMNITHRLDNVERLTPIRGAYLYRIKNRVFI